MKKLLTATLSASMLVLSLGSVTAQAKDSLSEREAKYHETVNIFRHAGESADFFHHCYGYAVFPTIGEGAFVVGGAGGKGGVFINGKLMGEATMAQVSVGFQAGGKAFSEIIFFENKAAADEFMSGSFEFGADASVTAITASAGASASTTGTEAGASGGQHDAVTKGRYYKGMAVFTVAKGGLMYQAAVAGQKFTFHPGHEPS